MQHICQAQKKISFLDFRNVLELFLYIINCEGKELTRITILST